VLAALARDFFKTKTNKVKPLEKLLTSNYSADRALREAIVWRRSLGRRCTKCGGGVSRAEIDEQVVGYACTECPALFPPEKQTT
jgi:hypothetical protein